MTISGSTSRLRHSPRDYVDYIASSPYVDAGEPTTGELFGLPGTFVDATVSEPAEQAGEVVEVAARARREGSARRAA